MTIEQEILAIQGLLARYCVLLDKLDLDGFADLWEPDGEMHVGRATWRGRDEIVANVGAATRGLHLAALPDLSVSGEAATGEQNFVFVASATRDLVLGRYEDRYLRAENGWRFARRRIVFVGADA